MKFSAGGSAMDGKERLTKKEELGRSVPGSKGALPAYSNPNLFLVIAKHLKVCKFASHHEISLSSCKRTGSKNCSRRQKNT